jgi:hypothetical protein
MTILNLMVYRHSAFYSPILSAIAGGFLAHEGFEPTYAVMPRQQKKLGVEFASESSRLNTRTSALRVR